MDSNNQDDFSRVILEWLSKNAPGHPWGVGDVGISNARGRAVSIVLGVPSGQPQPKLVIAAVGGGNRPRLVARTFLDGVSDEASDAQAKWLKELP